jgi:HSP20 family molecular chaperone IbpA
VSDDGFGDGFEDDFDESFEDAFDDEEFEEADASRRLPSLREVGESIGQRALDSVGRASARLQERRPLAADVLESEDAYLVVFDAPGADREDVQVQFDGTSVAIRADRFRDFQEGFETRVPGRGLALSGEVALPEGASVDADSAEATLTDSGTIRIRIPRRAGGRDLSVADDESTADESDETEASDDSESTEE